MNVQDISSHWVALHEALGVGAPLVDEAAYLALLAQVDAMVDATGGNDAHPLWGLIGVAGDRIREFEARHHPWPDTSTPAQVLASLMQDHGLTQGQLPEVGSQGVVSEVLAGKRSLNLRQIKALAARFSVPMDVFVG
ncbi:helix-turn-helix domain-containing protein [Sphaerotilus mobilis]|uniref:HTH-type transcriptional regulator/antitoxin HigA n=1 Tax=Sphaerotilus mobilis TaxID=47994 RepID=A0A4Q7LK23_9BURK|nr:transcriptional regulator [Sphaerotilus mobilis]RZS54744.1 HTH-type transcriptional regulator/antitoxin HigA [Sphaerotilus mobilis]